jgi:hypothetical protein
MEAFPQGASLGLPPPLAARRSPLAARRSPLADRRAPPADDDSDYAGDGGSGSMTRVEGGEP